MMNMPANPARHLTVALILAALLACGGCGGADSAGVRVAVQGEVKLDGRPLAAAVIAFHCGEGDKKMVAMGIVENGKYQLDAAKGPWVGRARVQFQPKPIAEKDFDAAIEQAARWRQPPKLVVMDMPPQYGEKSTLTVDITQSGENKFDFDLTSRP